jgi:hypothetical protein
MDPVPWGKNALRANCTIRLFVRSTFNDLQAERDACHRESFPRLKPLYFSSGLRFQTNILRAGEVVKKMKSGS